MTKEKAERLVDLIGDLIEAKISNKVTYPETGDYFAVQQATGVLEVFLMRELP